jgi:transcriptional regulator with AAA-type ATPase domain
LFLRESWANVCNVISPHTTNKGCSPIKVPVMSDNLAETSDIKLGDNLLAIVRSEATRKLVSMIHRVAPHPTAVLITGETGCGKELIARAIHMFSLRNNKPWIDVNCAALPEHLIESELFGYDKGAFSGADSVKHGFFEMANEGTLFLDEIGELESRLQVKLLRVLDGAPYYRLGGNKKISVDVRIIAATNRDLEEEVKSGKFRRDLYHRLGQVQLRVPPLRQRPEDIEGLAEHFLREQRRDAVFSPEALKVLRNYSWPGNVRELKNVVVNAAVMLEADPPVIDVCDLPQTLVAPSAPVEAASTIVASSDLDQMERQMILQALERTQGDQTKAAEQLGISRRTLSRKLKAYKAAGTLILSEPVLGVLSEDQEKYFRATLEVPVTVKPLNAPPGVVQSINVSTHGIGVHGIQMSGIVDSELELEFRLPDNTLMKAKAKVSWMDAKGRGGIKFHSIEPQDRLDSWLEQQLKKEGWARLL